MLAQEIDFHEIFKIHPTGMVLLSADLVILDANDEFLSAMGRKLEDLIGHNFYDEFPKLPEDPGGRPKWTALDEAMTSGRRQCDQLLRYDLEDPDRRSAPVAIEHRGRHRAAAAISQLTDPHAGR